MSYILALLSGLALGTLGGGGSILVVPILIYVMGIDPKIAIALSLAIVFLASSTAVVSNLKSKTINFKLAGLFIPFSLIGTTLGSNFSQYLSATIQLLIFSTVMFIVAITMLKNRKEVIGENFSMVSFIFKALAVGVLTGVIGVGGGFLIVPTLNILANQDIKTSISTSLFIIALNSLGGFLYYLNIFDIPWHFLITFAVFTSIGSTLGSKLSKKTNPDKLKKYFAYFLFVMSILITTKELLLS